MAERILSTSVSDADTPVFPTLKLIETPLGAVAAAQQRKARTPIDWPRGFHEGSRQAAGVPNTTWFPYYDSAMWFKQMYSAYRCANFVNFSMSATDPLALLISENAELIHSVMDPNATHGPDMSLKARGVAVWVSVNPNAHCISERVLDALSHWSLQKPIDESVMALIVRMTVIAGHESLEFFQRIAQEHSRDVGVTDWTYRITVRWADPLTKSTRSETHVSCCVPLTADAALIDIQQAIVRLLGTYNVPFPSALVRQVLTRVPQGAYAHGVNTVSEGFHHLTSGTPSVTLDSVAKTGEAGPLENIGVLVRLCQKSLKDHDIANSASFHGSLLSIGAYKGKAVAFAKEGANSGGGLGVPLGIQEETMGLHVCAVQAEQTPLYDRVTVFGPMGRPGEPIHPPCSCVWVESAAIRPVDANLLSMFTLHPCDKASLLPGNSALVEPFKRFFMLASILYTSLDASNCTTLKRNPVFASSDELTSGDNPTIVLPRKMDDDERRTERFLLAAFRVDLNSTRTTIGDAYAYLYDVGAPKSVVDVLLQAAGRVGISASLNCALEMCSEMVRNCTDAPDLTADMKRHKRLASVALDALSTCEQSDKRRPVMPVASAERIRRMIATLGLKRDAAVVVKVGISVQMVRKAIWRMVVAMGCVENEDKFTIPSLAIDCICAAVSERHRHKSAIDWDHHIQDELLKAASIAMVGVTAYTKQTPVCFALVSQVGSEMVSMQRITYTGRSDSSLDAIVAEAQPRVLILQTFGEYKARITATIPTSG